MRMYLAQVIVQMTAAAVTFFVFGVLPVFTGGLLGTPTLWAASVLVALLLGGLTSEDSWLYDPISWEVLCLTGVLFALDILGGIGWTWIWVTQMNKRVTISMLVGASISVITFLLVQRRRRRVM